MRLRNCIEICFNNVFNAFLFILTAEVIRIEEKVNEIQIAAAASIEARDSKVFFHFENKK